MEKKSKEPSEKELLIKRLAARVKFKRENLAKTIKFHREVEADLAKKIRIDQIQLNAFKK